MYVGLVSALLIFLAAGVVIVALLRRNKAQLAAARGSKKLAPGTLHCLTSFYLRALRAV